MRLSGAAKRRRAEPFSNPPGRKVSSSTRPSAAAPLRTKSSVVEAAEPTKRATTTTSGTLAASLCAPQAAIEVADAANHFTSEPEYCLEAPLCATAVPAAALTAPRSAELETSGGYGAWDEFL